MARLPRRPENANALPGAWSTVGWRRVEGAAVLAAAVVAWTTMEASWLLFAALLLAPDLAILGYLAGPRVGAAVYNAAHSYAGPAAALVAGLTGVAAAGWALPAAAVWAAHIGMDRALGYGLKLPTGFRDTDLGRIGSKKGPGFR
jgi:Domain of unknown function (DUF4260)